MPFKIIKKYIMRSGLYFVLTEFLQSFDQLNNSLESELQAIINLKILYYFIF